MIDSGVLLETFSGIQLSNRGLNALSKIGINTVGQFHDQFKVNYIGKIRNLSGVGNDTSEKLIGFIKFLQADGFLFEENKISDSDIPSIGDNLLAMNLTAFSSYLSLRTTNALSRAGISSVRELYANSHLVDDTYIRGLGNQGRKEIAEFKGYIGSKSSGDCIKNKGSAKISDYIGDKRLLSVLSYNLIEDIGQISDYVEGRADWKEIRFLKEGDQDALNEVHSKCKSTTLLSSIENPSVMSSIMNNFSEMDRLIVNERILGNLTLEEIGTKCQLTRERIRQIQKQLEDRIARLSDSFISADDSVSARIREILREWSFVILPRDAWVFDFLGFGETNHSMIYILLNGAAGVKGGVLDRSKKIFTLYPEDILIDGEDLKRFYNLIMDRLEKNNDDISINDLAYECILEDISGSSINSEGNIARKDELVKFINRIAELNEDYIVKEGVLHRFRKNLKLKDYIFNILSEYPDGLHYSEITRLLKSNFNIEAKERSVHSKLTHGASVLQKYVNIGNGTYVINGTGEYSGEKTGELIYGYLRSEGGPKEMSEIQDYVLRKKRIQERTVDAAIHYPGESRFCIYNDGRVGLREWQLGNERRKRG